MHDLDKLQAECPDAYTPKALSTDEIIALYDYYPWHDGLNPEIDYVTFKMLNLKKNEDGMRPAGARRHSVNFFSRAVKKSLAPLVSTDNNVICIVPSHEKDVLSKGMKQLVGKIMSDFGCTNKYNYLVRTETVDKASKGGSRTYQHHIDSIKAVAPDELKGKTVYLFDDVTTSGNSLLACKQILLDAGALQVIMIALGQTR